LIIANSEARIAKIRKEGALREANELIEETEARYQHEIEMGRATREGLLIALKEVKQSLDARGILHAELAKKIELLEKQIADAAIENQQRVLDHIREMDIEYQKLSDSVGGDIAEVIFDMEKQLRDQELTEEERVRVIRNATARIAEIRANAREKEAAEHVEALQEQFKYDKKHLEETLKLQLLLWQAAGEEGKEYVEAISEALKELEEEWTGTWQQLLSSVISGQSTLAEALQSLWDKHVSAKAESMAGRIVDAFNSARKTGLGFIDSLKAGFMALAGNAGGIITTLINEVVNLFTASKKVKAALAERAEQRLEQDKEYVDRLNNLLSSGFRRINNYTTETFTEKASYFFGLFSKTYTTTVKVLTEEAKEWIERIEGYLSDFQSNARSAINEALKAPDALSGWKVFLRDLRKGLYEQIVNAIIDAFVSGQLTTKAIAPFIQGLDSAMEAAMATGTFDARLFEAMMTPVLLALESQLNQLGPAFDAVFNLIQKLKVDMGVVEGIVDDGGSRGTQISEITGPSRDLLIELLTPLKDMPTIFNGLSEAFRAAVDKLVAISAIFDVSGAMGTLVQLTQTVKVLAEKMAKDLELLRVKALHALDHLQDLAARTFERTAPFADKAVRLLEEIKDTTTRIRAHLEAGGVGTYPTRPGPGGGLFGAQWNVDQLQILMPAGTSSGNVLDQIALETQRMASRIVG
jgi:hypothetical protein